MKIVSVHSSTSIKLLPIKLHASTVHQWLEWPSVWLVYGHPSSHSILAAFSASSENRIRVNVKFGAPPCPVDQLMLPFTFWFFNKQYFNVWQSFWLLMIFDANAPYCHNAVAWWINFHIFITRIIICKTSTSLENTELFRSIVACSNLPNTVLTQLNPSEQQSVWEIFKSIPRSNRQSAQTTTRTKRCLTLQI